MLVIDLEAILHGHDHDPYHQVQLDGYILEYQLKHLF